MKICIPMRMLYPQKTILNCNKTIDESQVLWISKYAPLIKMSLTKLQIADLSKCSSVEYIYLDEHEMIATDVSAMSSSGTTSASTWQQTTNVTYVKSHGYNGAGVKVGLYDVGVLRYNDLEQAHKNVFVTLNSSGRLIADPYAPTGDPSHAAYCGSIIAATNVITSVVGIPERAIRRFCAAKLKSKFIKISPQNLSHFSR